MAKIKPIPKIFPLEIGEQDENGDILCHPISWKKEIPVPKIFLYPGLSEKSHPNTGDYILARINRETDYTYSAKIIRRIPKGHNNILGVIKFLGGSYYIASVEKKKNRDLSINKEDLNGAQAGDLVLAQTLRKDFSRSKVAKVIKCLEPKDTKHFLSSIALHQYNIPFVFPREPIKLANSLTFTDEEIRKDFITIPLVTIDGYDARDFDDAVWAEKDLNTKNKGGWHLVIAIADVALYVRQDDPIDLEARKRGNSVYFPDQVIPMLPENLSNNLCSLVPNQIRPCLAVEIWIDAKGSILRHQFSRGIMKSAARLTYSQVQNAREGRLDETTLPIFSSVISPLYGAYESLKKARDRRHALEISLPETKVQISKSGDVLGLHREETLESHKLIEEFMIAANIAAASSLHSKKAACVYRNHDEPSLEKINNLSKFLKSIGSDFTKNHHVGTETFNTILLNTRNTSKYNVVNQMILRSQAQAEYRPQNLGHFGLGLEKYCHFTSPIRRYSDLLVHRALIRTFKLGEGGDPRDKLDLNNLAMHLSAMERRAATAERDTVDRFSANIMLSKIGETFDVYINSVTRFGLFVSQETSGVEGLIPIRYLPGDYYKVDASMCRLVGEKYGNVYSLGETLQVKLEQADFLTGRLTFTLIGSKTKLASGRRKRKGRLNLNKKTRKKQKRAKKYSISHK